MTLDEVQTLLTDANKRIEQARTYVNFEKAQADIEALEAEASAPGFWDDPEVAQQHMQKIKAIKVRVEPWLEIENETNDLIELAEMAAEDPSMAAEVIEGASTIGVRLDRLEALALMNDPEDKCNAFVHIHAGAGGTESCDWASMLLRMYTRWCERNGMDVEMLELLDGDEAGVRSATLLVKGNYVYGQLKAESGVHRLVRISPFDANKRRHTSFCSVHVTPEIDDSVEIEIRDEDLRVDTFRASGAGGQHVNKTESAIRITHQPTGIVVSCQNQRSQHQNRAQAMKVLRSRLYQHEMEKREAEMAKRSSEKKEIGWGSQIRSYVFQPYQMIKDLRSLYQTSNINAVMDGALDPFIEAYLRWATTGENSGEAGDLD